MRQHLRLGGALKLARTGSLRNAFLGFAEAPKAVARELNEQKKANGWKGSRRRATLSLQAQLFITVAPPIAPSSNSRSTCRGGAVDDHDGRFPRGYPRDAAVCDGRAVGGGGALHARGGAMDEDEAEEQLVHGQIAR
jgi:hypothetical protein